MESLASSAFPIFIRNSAMPLSGMASLGAMGWLYRQGLNWVLFPWTIIVISNKFATFTFTCKPYPGRGYSDYQYLKVLHFLVKRL